MSINMWNWRLFPRLREPDWAYWERLFPEGLGPSIFSAPAWQRLMAAEVERPWRLMFLQAGAETEPLTLPVFVRDGNWGRHEIRVYPVSYYVTPLETQTLDEGHIGTIIRAVQVPFTAVFVWWLPPWSAWRLPASSFRRGFGQSQWSLDETYVVTLDRPAAEYLNECVSQRHARQVRVSYDRGLEIIERPGPDLIEEYYQLYARVWAQEQWIGAKLAPAFFHGVVTNLGDGGRLILMRYQGQVVGGGVILFDRQAVHYYQGTQDRNIKAVFPHSVLLAWAMEQAQVRGLARMNLGGVNPGNQGLVEFKRSWGAEVMPVPVVRWQYDGPALVRKTVQGIRRWVKTPNRADVAG